MSNQHWPMFDLRIRTPRLELRPDWDDGLVALAELAAEGIHDPSWMPFTEPWSDAPPGKLEAVVLQWHWRQRAEWSTDKWHLPFIVLLDGEVVGTQGMAASHFDTLKVVETGSWLGRRFQGQGIGKEMRAAVLHLAFEALGAVRALSGAYEDNAASLAVSRGLGYIENGDQLALRRTERGRLLNLLLTRERWEQCRRPDAIAVEHVEPCLAMFGVEPVVAKPSARPTDP